MTTRPDHADTMARLSALIRTEQNRGMGRALIDVYTPKQLAPQDPRDRETAIVWLQTVRDNGRLTVAETDPLIALMIVRLAGADFDATEGPAFDARFRELRERHGWQDEDPDEAHATPEWLALWAEYDAAQTRTMVAAFRAWGEPAMADLYARDRSAFMETYTPRMEPDAKD